MALPLPKLLVVGAVDRMDATLEAAHMQGRFRLVSWAVSCLGSLGRSEGYKSKGGARKERFCGCLFAWRRCGKSR